MSTVKTLKGRVSNKHNTEAGWLQSVFVDGDETKGLVSNPFYPLAGELIIYDPDSIYTYPRFKIGRWVNPEDESLGTVRLDLLDFVDENINVLGTREKTITGAINEINNKIGIDNNIVGTWVFIDDPDLTTLPESNNVLFSSYGNNYTNLARVETGSSSWGIYAMRYGDQDFLVYINNPEGNYGIAHGWLDDSYKTITITEAPTDEVFITWLKNNATKQSETILERFDNYQLKEDNTLETTDKTVVGAINEVNDKTVDKIHSMEQGQNADYIEYGEQYGIRWVIDGCMRDENDTPIAEYNCDQNAPIAEGDNVTFTVDDENKVVKINSPAQIPITHSELVSLRDNGELIPGQFYRITDYQCTTTQENTRAMNNQFDIIVQALSNNTLSENASADYHFNEDGTPDGYFAKLESGFRLDPLFNIIEDETGTSDGEPYKVEDVFIAYDYIENPDGDTVPVLYKTNINDYPDEVDYEDIFYYVGTYELDGTTYDRWRKIDSEYTWDGSVKRYVLTDVVIENGVFIDSIVNPKEGVNYLANLPAWEIKYSLDDDTSRFAWAAMGQVITNLETNTSNGQPLSRLPDYDNALSSMGYTDYADYIYAWGAPTDSSSMPNTVVFSKNETLVNGEIVYNANSNELQAAEVEGAGAGKGVIYYMKDEWNNECPYDFKNIQFSRKISLENGYPELDEENGADTWVYTFCGNSYHIGNDEWSELKDGSLESPYGHQSDERFSTFHHNIIGSYIKILDPENEDYTLIGKLYLNDIVMLGYWEEVNSDNSQYYRAKCCYFNTLGSNCYSNTFGSDCSLNTFGNYCNNITLDIGCYLNTFGDNCSDNTFGGGCVSNTFGSNCCDNTFGDECSSNTLGKNSQMNIFGQKCMLNIFGNKFFRNTFGNNCDYNTFGNNCNYNTFGNDCYYNTFGNDCNYNTFGSSTEELISHVKYVHFAEGCKYIKLLNSETGNSSKYVQDVVVSTGIRGTFFACRELQVSRNAAPVVFEAANTTHIILD